MLTVPGLLEQPDRLPPFRRDAEAERQALATTDEYMATLNARDWQRNAATLNFPHIRISSGRVRVWPTLDDYAAANADRVRQTFEAGWHRSEFDERVVVHSAADKVHLAVCFTRYDAANRPLASYRAFWVVTRQDGHWGLQFRSSFAP